MTDNGDSVEIILQKLDQQAQLIADQGSRLSGIERTLSAMAVQEEKIVNIKGQLSAIWAKYDKAFGPEGTIANIRAHQAACPKDYVESAVTRQWVTIGLLATIITGALAKAFGFI